MKVGDLVYWHEDAWLMSQGIQPKVIYGIIVSERSSSKPNRKIWNVVQCDTGQAGIVHESDLNVKVCHESR